VVVGVCWWIDYRKYYKKPFSLDFRALDKTAFYNACTIGMADGRLFVKLWFWRVSLFAGLCNVSDVCVRRGMGRACVRLFNIMAYYRMALVCGGLSCGRSYNAALC
jgi:hypothetical protein